MIKYSDFREGEILELVANNSDKDFNYKKRDLVFQIVDGVGYIREWGTNGADWEQEESLNFQIGESTLNIDDGRYIISHGVEQKIKFSRGSMVSTVLKRI